MDKLHRTDLLRHLTGDILLTQHQAVIQLAARLTQKPAIKTSDSSAVERMQEDIAGMEPRPRCSA